MAIDSTRYRRLSKPGAVAGDNRAKAAVASAVSSSIPRPSTGEAASSLIEIFDSTVTRHRARVALDADDATLTYGELFAAAERLASSLREQGVGPGERVGIQIESGSSALYVGIVGVLVAGAAYVPVDADDPPARAAAIWAEADVCGVLEVAGAPLGAGARHDANVPLDARSVGEPGELRFRRLREPRGQQRDPVAEDDAWIIFTSGSSGRPKGVAVSHRSAAAFVAAERRLWTVRPEDRVLAGLSVSFDASCEEMWMAWGSGAALVPAPRAVVRSGADLGPWLVRRGVTIISTVPTLAAMWNEQTLAKVRLLILGGEACPQELGWRLSAGREVWNTYGPTEATVVSTAARIRAGEPVLIGWPLAGWEVAVVEESGRPVPLGEPGELVIGGVGLARYLDLTLDAERFRGLPELGWERAYRSGDVVRETIDGFEFLGRRDHQVKLAGRRLELGEVEANLSAIAGVRAAAAAVQSTAAGNKVLVGYVVGDVDSADVRAAVAEHLPDGLAPVIVVLDELPLAASGKVDRGALPWPPPDVAGPTDPSLTGTAAWLAERFSDQLGPVALSAETDFFASGGNSLAAAKLVSALRERFPAVAVSDVYEYRRLGQLAARLDELGERRDESRFELATASWHWGAVQLVGMLVLLVIHASEWLIGAFAYADILAALHVASGLPQVPWPWLLGAWLLLATPMGRTGIVLAAKRSLLPRLEPGRYPRHSWLASRIWFLERLTDVCRLGRLAGTPWAERYARLLGADVGAGARLSSVPQPGALVHIGSGATLESDVDMHGWWMDGQQIVVGEVRIGARARVGTRTVLMPGALVGEGAEVEPGSVVTGTVPSGERWAGAPARYEGRAGEGWLEHAPADDPWPRSSLLLYGASLLVAGLLPVLAFIPGILIVRLLGAPTPTLYSSPGVIALEALVLTSTFLLSYALLVASVVRATWRLVRPGWHVERGLVGWALWFTENVLSSARIILFPLYCSLYTRPWLRLMGLAIGHRCEISTAVGLNNLASFEELSFAADDVTLASARARDGWLHLGPITVGKRTFVGNCSVLRHGTEVGANSIIGVLTVAPQRSVDGTCWLGSPALELPRIPETADPARTTDPPARLIIGRAAMDLLRILLPWTAGLVLGWVTFIALAAIGRRLGILAEIAVAPLVLLVSGFAAAALTILLKWVVIGRYRSGQHPFWSFFVWRDELINSTQELLAGQWLIAFAMGTPVMSLYLRAMGARVGRGVWCETMTITEFDLVDLKDGAVINRHACVQTHLFHDRLLRMGPSVMGAGSTLGPSSVVLPDTKVGAGTCVGARSVVMRGEELPGGTRWHGAPVVALPAPAALTASLAP